MQIYIRRNKEDFGPYSKEAVLEYIKQGVFTASDFACYAGMAEWRTVSELLGIGIAAQKAKPGTARAGIAPSASKTAPAASSQSQTTRSLSRQPVRRAARTPEKPSEHKRTGMIVLNLVLVSIVAAGLYIRMGGGGATGQRILAAVSAIISRPAPPSAPVTEAPAPAPVAPAPVIEKAPVAAATPPPVVAATPAPPKPFTPADLAGNPAAWPKTLILKAAATFPAVLNGQVVGSVTMPAGTEVKLVNIVGDQLTLDYNGGTQSLPWTATNLEQAAAKNGAGSAAATPATDATAAATSAAPPGN